MECNKDVCMYVRGMKWAGHVTQMGGDEKYLKFYVANREEKKSLG
jgi:hypothetical protein